MLPLTLRPTRLHASALRQLADWSVLHDGKVIGRISETHAPYRPELAWSWSITELLDSRAGVTSHGNAASLEEAKTAIQASWDAWQAWPRPAAETAELFRWYGDVLGAAFAYWGWPPSRAPDRCRRLAGDRRTENGRPAHLPR